PAGKAADFSLQDCEGARRSHGGDGAGLGGRGGGSGVVGGEGHARGRPRLHSFPGGTENTTDREPGVRAQSRPHTTPRARATSRRGHRAIVWKSLNIAPGTY